MRSGHEAAPRRSARRATVPYAALSRDLQGPVRGELGLITITAKGRRGADQFAASPRTETSSALPAALRAQVRQIGKSSAATSRPAQVRYSDDVWLDWNRAACRSSCCRQPRGARRQGNWNSAASPLRRRTTVPRRLLRRPRDHRSHRIDSRASQRAPQSLGPLPRLRSAADAREDA